MTTIKQRINITANQEVERALKNAAKRDGVPVATKAAELLSIALEIEEDTYLGSIANERALTDRSLFVHHDKAWK